MKKVLVVENEKNLHNKWRNKLEGKVELVCALFVEEAKEQFVANPDWAAIVVDADIGDEAIALVKKFRETFTTGPMFAISNIGINKRALVCAGCNYEVGTKESMPQKLLEVLGL